MRVGDKALAMAKRLVQEHPSLGIDAELNNALRAQFPGIRP